MVHWWKERRVPRVFTSFETSKMVSFSENHRMLNQQIVNYNQTSSCIIKHHRTCSPHHQKSNGQHCLENHPCRHLSSRRSGACVSRRWNRARLRPFQWCGAATFGDHLCVGPSALLLVQMPMWDIYIYTHNYIRYMWFGFLWIYVKMGDAMGCPKMIQHVSMIVVGIWWNMLVDLVFFFKSHSANP